MVAVGDDVAVDLFQHSANVGVGVRAFRRVVPPERTEPSASRATIFCGFRLQATTEVIHEPQLAATVAGWLDRFLMELDEPLCVGEAALFFSVTGGGEEEDLRPDVLRPQFAALDLRTVMPEGRRLGLDHLADYQPFQ